jgi:uncharacterized LabA/DUF88 family protein
MSITYSSQRVAIFIDTANLYHTTKHVYHARAAFAPIIETIIRGRSLVRSLAYTISTETGDEKNFIESLQSLGIEIHSKELIKYKNGDTKGDWDVGITVDAIAIAPHVDVVVLVTGDGDFAPLVKHLKSLGVRVEAASFEQSMSQLLLDVVDGFINLSESPEQYLIPVYGKKIKFVSSKSKKPEDAIMQEIGERNMAIEIKEKGRGGLVQKRATKEVVKQTSLIQPVLVLGADTRVQTQSQAVNRPEPEKKIIVTSVQELVGGEASVAEKQKPKKRRRYYQKKTG